MHFTRLRLTGFKSFVDSTELWIEPGLTGVVGPNGCGKSNLVEALRWVMGETSAKQMRGGEMDDVIFGGTDRRPARNLAEVSLQLDNADRTAPSHFNDSDDLEIIRRIERGEGSHYQVNGNDTRARDVQTLFADLATGARSTALVSQGRIGALISAKPKDRRHILEEAAGITGLHSRRHEAELRLRAAEKNLERLDDLLGALEEQLKALKKQARQATRYRNLSDHIRRAEAIAIHHQWNAAKTEQADAKEKFDAAERAVEELTRETAAASSRESEAAARLPSLREAEAGAAAALQRLIIARDGLDQEEQRIEAEKREIENRIQQIQSDMEREQGLKKDAEEAFARLERETASLTDAQSRETQDIDKAAGGRAAADEDVSRIEQDLTRLTETIAANETRQSGLRRQISDGEARRARITQRLADLERDRQAAQAIIDEQSGKEALDARVIAAREALEAARASFDEAGQRRQEAAERETGVRRRLQDANSALDKLQAEEQALTKFLTVGNPELWPPMIDAVSVRPGYELALAAAMGDDLSAPSDEAAPVHWRTLPSLDGAAPLPHGATPLSEFVDAPAALSRRLAQIGLVADAEEGKQLARALSAGQRLVSRDGALWRWDGYTATGGDAGAAASRLTQRNRLEDLQQEIATAESVQQSAQTEFDRAQEARKQAEENEAQARDTARSRDSAYQEIRDEQAALNQKSADARSRVQSAEEAAEALRGDDAELTATIRSATEELNSLQDTAEKRAEADRLRGTLSEARSTASESRSVHDRLVSEAAARRQRLNDIGNETASWKQRALNASQQAENLVLRLTDARTALEEINARPAEIAEKREVLFGQIEAAENLRGEAADRLAEAETALAEISGIRKEKEAALAEKREERVRYEAVLEQCAQALQVITERAAERIKARPEEALEAVEVKDDEKLPDREQIEARVERLKRERENMGAVNLRAEAEAQELDERINSMLTEREDLLAAIARLRTGIASLNREGRQRLLAAFKEVDEHFQKLFIRLFGGGKAHLSLTEEEDPLEAGLEVMASPPGKKLQSMSLLSGGEQALTALSLLFAVFLTNPAPICVLDEVDAPLDDANVERFCLLIQEIAEQTGTRFLVVTHHRLTMARVDRLFGVTMGERGVSQLVSVDLKAAEKLRDSA